MTIVFLCLHITSLAEISRPMKKSWSGLSYHLCKYPTKMTSGFFHYFTYFSNPGYPLKISLDLIITSADDYSALLLPQASFKYSCLPF